MKKMSISSPEFSDKGTIPSMFTCDGEDINPPLRFENVPEDAVSIALLVEDSDSVGKDWLHWAVFNIDPSTTVIHDDSVPRGSIEVMTDFGTKGYGGPCPANGIHRYHFKLFALDSILDITEDVTMDEIKQMLDDHTISKAELTGLYSRE
jgi:Raf kinase inhibitor-like YbhB/YbcL family protein